MGRKKTRTFLVTVRLVVREDVLARRLEHEPDAIPEDIVEDWVMSALDDTESYLLKDGLVGDALRESVEEVKYDRM